MRRYRIHHLPVVDGRTLVGIVSDRDLTGLAEDHVVDVMTRNVAEVHEHATVDEVVALMQAGRFNSVVITSTTGIEGIFTSTDAMLAFSELLQRTHESER